MKLERHIVDGVAVIGLSESLEIDIANCDEFKTAFAALLQSGDTRVVLDATRVVFFDSAGLGALLTINKHVIEKNGRMVISGLNRAVRDLFHMVGFDVVFLTTPDVEQAIKSFKE